MFEILNLDTLPANIIMPLRNLGYSSMSPISSSAVLAVFAFSLESYSCHCGSVACSLSKRVTNGSALPGTAQHLLNPNPNVQS